MPEYHAGDRFGRLGPGRVLILDDAAAREVNAIRAELRRLGNLVGVPPVNVSEDGAGHRVAIDLAPTFPAKLSGTGNPYSYVEQVAGAGGTWSDMPGGRAGSDAYEANAVTGLAGKVANLRLSDAGDWRFQFVRRGTPGPCGTICVPVVRCNPDFGGPLLAPGATVTVSLGAFSDTCTTVSQVATLTLGFTGSGYTNGTDFAVGFSGGGGSGAAGLFDVVSGHVANVRLTSGGSGYTSNPTVSFSASAGGSGATGTATVKSQCCIPVPATGTYAISVSLPDYRTVATTAGLSSCGSTATTPTITLDKVCPGINLSGTLHGTDSAYGSFTTSSGTGNLTANGTIVTTCPNVLGTGEVIGTGDFNITYQLFSDPCRPVLQVSWFVCCTNNSATGSLPMLGSQICGGSGLPGKFTLQVTDVSVDCPGLTATFTIPPNDPSFGGLPNPYPGGATITFTP